MAEFVGGPLDGTVRAFDDDEPPVSLDLKEAVFPDVRSAGIYTRVPSKRVTGPRWLFIYHI